MYTLDASEMKTKRTIKGCLSSLCNSCAGRVDSLLLTKHSSEGSPSLICHCWERRRRRRDATSDLREKGVLSLEWLANDSACLSVCTLYSKGNGITCLHLAVGCPLPRDNLSTSIDLSGCLQWFIPNGSFMHSFSYLLFQYRRDHEEVRLDDIKKASPCKKFRNRKPHLLWRKKLCAKLINFTNSSKFAFATWKLNPRISMCQYQNRFALLPNFRFYPTPRSALSNQSNAPNLTAR